MVTHPPRPPVQGEPIMVRHSCGQWWLYAGVFDRFDVDGSPVTKREFVFDCPRIPIAAIWVGPPWPKGYEEIDNPLARPYRTEEDDAWLGRTAVEGWDPRRKVEPRRSVGYTTHRGTGYGEWAFLSDGLHLPASRRLPIVCSIHGAAREAA